MEALTGVSTDILVALIIRLAMLSAFIYASLSWAFDTDAYRFMIRDKKYSIIQQHIKAKSEPDWLAKIAIVMLSKATWAFIYSIALSFWIKIDAIQVFMVRAEPTWIGIFITAGVLAGGARVVLKIGDVFKTRMEI